jgi:hypothetical protein
VKAWINLLRIYYVETSSNPITIRNGARITGRKRSQFYAKRVDLFGRVDAWQTSTRIIETRWFAWVLPCQKLAVSA